LRIFVVVAALLLLAGCEANGSGWRSDYHSTNDEQTSAAPSAATTRPSMPVDAHCVAVARQRAMDARENGYDVDMEDTIYQGTYKDCAAWDARHPQ
jgi:hypothetical protein